MCEVTSQTRLDKIFFVRSSRISVDLLSYESKTTDKQEQYDWRAEKNLGGSEYIMPSFGGKMPLFHTSGFSSKAVRVCNILS